MEKDPYGFTEITRGKPHNRAVKETIEDLDKEARNSARALRTLASTVGKLRKTVETQELELNKIRLAVSLLDYWEMAPHKRFKLTHNFSKLVTKVNALVEEHKEFKKEMWSERREKALLVKRYDPDLFARNKEYYEEIIEEAEIEMGYKKKPKVIKESDHDNQHVSVAGRQ